MDCPANSLVAILATSTLFMHYTLTCLEPTTNRMIRYSSEFYYKTLLHV